MKIADNIRTLYSPVQPRWRGEAGNVSYLEFLPDLRLQPFIYCYWELKSLRPLASSFDYKVVADGCMDFFLDLNRPQESYVMGFCKAYTSFALQKEFHYVGIRFLPGRFPRLFNIKASELSGRAENLELVLPQTAQFLSQNLHSDLAPEQIRVFLDQYFLKCLSGTRVEEDARLDKAMIQLAQEITGQQISTISAGVSPRQLRRLFDFYIGGSPKSFSRILRFQLLLRSRPSSGNWRGEKSFLDVGYFDQAHFIKDFKTLYGDTPAKAF